MRLEDLEIVEAAKISMAVAAGAPEPETRKAKRRPLPDHLPRRDVVHAAPGTDGCVCGGKMTAFGESITEVLEYIPGRFEVVRHVRPSVACQRCDAISQAPAPALPIPRGKAASAARPCCGLKVRRSPAAVPPAVIYARDGVDLDRSTMPNWVGQVSWPLKPLIDHIRRHVFAAAKIHIDDATLPVLAPGTGKTKTGRLWVYVRDDRNWQGSDPPAAIYFYSPDR